MSLPIPSLNAFLDTLFGKQKALEKKGADFEGTVEGGRYVQKRLSEFKEYKKNKIKPSPSDVYIERKAFFLPPETEAIEDAKKGCLSKIFPPTEVEKDIKEPQVNVSLWDAPDALIAFRNRLGEPSRNFLFKVIMPISKGVNDGIVQLTDNYVLDNRKADCNEKGEQKKDEKGNLLWISEQRVPIVDLTEDVLSRCVSVVLPTFTVTEREVRMGGFKRRLPDSLEVKGNLTLKFIEGVDQKVKMWAYRWLNGIFNHRGVTSVAGTSFTIGVLELHPTTRKPVGGVLLFFCFPISISESNKSQDADDGFNEVTVELACSDMMFGDINELLRIAEGSDKALVPYMEDATHGYTRAVEIRDDKFSA